MQLLECDARFDVLGRLGTSLVNRGLPLPQLAIARVRAILVPVLGAVELLTQVLEHLVFEIFDFLAGDFTGGDQLLGVALA